jgi:hypothetical protein
MEARGNEPPRLWASMTDVCGQHSASPILAAQSEFIRLLASLKHGKR